MTTPGGFSAGTVFLQVVPSFDDAMRRIRDWAKDLDKALGDEIGDNDAIADGVEKQLKDPKIKRAASKSGQDSGGAFANSLRAAIDKALRDLPKIKIKSDSSQADKDLRAIELRLKALRDAEIDVDISAEDAIAEVDRLVSRLESVDGNTVSAAAEFDASRAMASLNRWKAALEGADGKRVKPDVDNSASAHLEQLANNLRGFNALILLGAATGPLLVPVLGALAGAALAAGAAFAGAAVGLGALILGFSGIGGAVKAINEVEKNAAQDATARAKALRTAAQSVQAAERGVEDARLAAAQAAEQASERTQRALDAQRDAEEALRDAQRDAQRAQERLTQARVDAQDRIEDLALRARGGALAERQALVDLYEAEVAYRNVMADGSATNLDREEASIALERARLGIEQVRTENGRLAEEQAEVARTGVEGTEEVISAREGVVDANERVADAERALADASEGVTRARVEGARAVAAANRNVEDALVRLSNAQQDYTDAVNDTSAAQQKLNEEMSQLGPAGQAFAIFLAGLKDEFRTLRDAVQAGLLPGVQAFFEALLPYMPQITAFLAEMGTVLGDLFRRFGEFLTTNPAMLAFFEMLAQYAPIFTSLFGDVFMNLMETFAILAVAFAPLAEQMVRALAGLLDQFNAYLQSPEGQQMLQDFIAYVRESGPAVMKALGALALALLNLAVALAPYADELLKLFTGFLIWIAEMDPRTLAAIVLSIIGFTFALQAVLAVLGLVGTVAGAVAGVMALFAAGATAAGIALGLGIAAAVLAVIALLVVAYFKFEWFRDGVNAVFTAVWEAVKLAFEGVKWLWDNVLWPVLEAMWAIFRTVFEGIVLLADLFWIGMKFALGGLWDFLVELRDKPVIKQIVDAFAWLFDTALAGASAFWDDLSKLFKGGVRLVIDVINNGIIDPLNGLAELVGSDKRITRLQDPFAQGKEQRVSGARPQEFAAGGLIPGFSPTPTADNIPALLTAGEYVLPVNAVKRLRATFGDGFLEMLRAGMPGFAEGGLVPFGRMLQARGFRISEHPLFGGVRGRHAPNSLHYSGQALDINYGPGGENDIEKAAIDGIVGMADHYGLRALWRIPAHFNHLHVDTGSGGNMIGKLAGGAASILGGGLQKLLGDNVASNALGFVVGKVKGLDAFKTLSESPFGQILGATLGLPIRFLVDWVKDRTGALGDFFSGDDDDGSIPKLYDQGGWLPPGLTTVLNATGRPEPVFTGDQFDRLTAGGASGDEFHWHTTGGDPEAFAEAIMFRKRLADRGGVYAGRT